MQLQLAARPSTLLLLSALAGAAIISPVVDASFVGCTIDTFCEAEWEDVLNGDMSGDCPGIVNCATHGLNLVETLSGSDTCLAAIGGLSTCFDSDGGKSATDIFGKLLGIASDIFGAVDCLSSTNINALKTACADVLKDLAATFVCINKIDDCPSMGNCFKAAVGIPEETSIDSVDIFFISIDWFAVASAVTASSTCWGNAEQDFFSPVQPKLTLSSIDSSAVVQSTSSTGITEFGNGLKFSGEVNITVTPLVSEPQRARRAPSVSSGAWESAREQIERCFPGVFDTHDFEYRKQLSENEAKSSFETLVKSCVDDGTWDSIESEVGTDFNRIMQHLAFSTYGDQNFDTTLEFGLSIAGQDLLSIESVNETVSTCFNVGVLAGGKKGGKGQKGGGGKPPHTKDFKEVGDGTGGRGRKNAKLIAKACDNFCIDISSNGDFGAGCQGGIGTSDLLVGTFLEFLQDDLNKVVTADASLEFGFDIRVHPDGTISFVPYARSKGVLTLGGVQVFEYEVDTSETFASIKADVVEVFHKPQPKHLLMLTPTYWVLQSLKSIRKVCIGKHCIHPGEWSAKFLAFVGVAAAALCGCFPGNGQVELLSGLVIPMSALEVGDVVRVSKMDFSPVYLFTHKNASIETEFVRISTADASIRLSAGHYLYVNGKLQTAQTVEAGDSVSAGVVISVRKELATGLYNPHTLNGDIYVDGIKTSTYTEALHPKVAHAILTSVRWLYEILPAKQWEMFCDGVLHASPGMASIASKIGLSRTDID